jgi:hypothetical protein
MNHIHNSYNDGYRDGETGQPNKTQVIW